MLAPSLSMSSGTWCGQSAAAAIGPLRESRRPSDPLQLIDFGRCSVRLLRRPLGRRSHDGDRCLWAVAGFYTLAPGPLAFQILKP